MSLDKLEQAWQLLQEAYQAQVEGDYDHAVQLYEKSLAVQPTAEAHTFLGWTYHFQGRLEEAIAECKRAIEIDPDFGNPYNDIGAYLIEMRRFDEAIPWLERTLRRASKSGCKSTSAASWRFRWPSPRTTSDAACGALRRSSASSVHPAIRPQASQCQSEGTQTPYRCLAALAAQVARCTRSSAAIASSRQAPARSAKQPPSTRPDGSPRSPRKPLK